ncbi:MAG: hypothetical protein EA425_02575 [Puniceicoccaceae bacterium]|nr:MAG: hypothetical protein EA425_02575 [Puniceicoccaceae bacterium]
MNHEPNNPRPDAPDRLGRALRDLPPLRAPATLTPRVMAALARRESAWWRRPVPSWPLPARAALCGFGAVVLTLLIFVQPQVFSWIGQTHIAQGLLQAGSQVLQTVTTLASLAGAIGLALQKAAGPVFLLSLGLTAVLALGLYGLLAATRSSCRFLALPSPLQ